MKFIRDIFSFLSTTVVILACIYGLVYLPKLFGYYPHIIADDAMDPTYPPSTIIYYKKVDFKDVFKSDVVTYKENDIIKCSRVIDISDNTVILRDDNRGNKEDKKVASNRILGKNMPFVIRFLGAFILLVNNNLKLVVLIGGLIIIVNAIFHLFRKKEKKKVLNIEE